MIGFFDIGSSFLKNGDHRLGLGMFRRTLIVVLCLILAAASADILNAQPQKEAGYRLKAAYLFNFLRFIDWPSQTFASPTAPIVLGIVGKDPFGGVLDEIVKNETVGGRKIVVQRISTIDEVKHCHLVFVPNSESHRFAEWLTALAGSNVLTVSEAESPADVRGDINFFIEENKLRFEIDLDTVRKAEYQISSKLLRLAKVKSGKTYDR